MPRLFPLALTARRSSSGEIDCPLSAGVSKPCIRRCSPESCFCVVGTPAKARYNERLSYQPGDDSNDSCKLLALLLLIRVQASAAIAFPRV